MERSLLDDRSRQGSAFAMLEERCKEHAHAIARRHVVVEPNLALERVLQVLVRGDGGAAHVLQLQSKIAQHPQEGRERMLKVFRAGGAGGLDVYLGSQVA